MNDAGKVAFTPKGDYSSTVTYEYLDTMVFNGNAYAALRTTTGNAPTDSSTDENWALLARGGESVPLASETTPGVVKASSDIGVSDDGSMVLKTDFTQGLCENLIPYPYYHNTITRSGITFTDNGDGTITANGTATANYADFYVVASSQPILYKKGTYTLSGCPSGGSTSTYFLLVAKNVNGTLTRITQDIGFGVTFELEEETNLYFFIRILKDTTVDNLTFKPMLEYGTIAHEYKPYSISNAGLQKQIDNDVVHNSNISSSTAITETGKYALDATEKNASVDGTLANQIGTINTNLGKKQDKLTFDASPTEGSSNPVKSNGIISEIRSYTLPLKNGMLDDALNIDLSNPYAEINKPHRVLIGNTINMPTNMAGVRYVDYYSSNNVGVRLIGRNNGGAPVEFANYYIDGKWTGWVQIGSTIQEVKTISTSQTVTLGHTIGIILSVQNCNVGKSGDYCVGYSIQSGNTIYIGKTGSTSTDFVVSYMPK